jgi:hypothetical protein
MNAANNDEFYADGAVPKECDAEEKVLNISKVPATSHGGGANRETSLAARVRDAPPCSRGSRQEVSALTRDCVRRPYSTALLGSQNTLIRCLDVRTLEVNFRARKAVRREDQLQPPVAGTEVALA